MCVYVIMLIFLCILCYYVYSVKSSQELVFIVIQKPNSNKVFFFFFSCGTVALTLSLGPCLFVFFYISGPSMVRTYQ